MKVSFISTSYLFSEKGSSYQNTPVFQKDFVFETKRQFFVYFVITLISCTKRLHCNCDEKKVHNNKW